jgi:16S rRNA C1402 (ribose-2'-O) methylase RsmI
VFCFNLSKSRRNKNFCFAGFRLKSICFQYTHLQRIKNDSRLLIFFSIPIRVNDLEGSVKQIFISLQIAKNDLEGSVEGTCFPMIFLAFKTDSNDLEG